MQQFNNKNIHRIMVRATNWIGDGVMMTPALEAIRTFFPQAEITVVANPLVAQLFTHHPWCDRVMVYDRKGEHRGFAGLWRFSRKLKSQRFDLAILLQKAFEPALLAFLARIPERIGFSTDGRGFLLSRRTPLTDDVRCQHHSRHYLHMLRQFGIEGGSGDQYLEVSAPERQWAEEKLGHGSFIAINPGAAYGSAKRWIPERFAEVGDRLADEYGVRIVLTGGPGEAEIGSDIESFMTRKPLNLIGRTSIRQMMAIIDRCRLMVSNDSGPMHVAAALDVPVVAVFGATDHTTTYPWTKQYRVVRRDFECAPCLKRQCPTDHRCMEAVTVDDVLA
ncbi:MAG TPA: lipopolysaccharide heptosyltransferase II, partial [Desulfuromonadales bacterium]|nr:lipopolysaccharide heptosyltransferase II [Desulfuromonadales bacterium]